MINRRLASLFASLLLAACGSGAAAPEPESLDPALSTHPGYQTQAGWRTECTGRHLVDLPPGDLEWATLHDDLSGRASYAGVDGGLWVEGESLIYGRILVEVYPTQFGSLLKRRREREVNLREILDNDINREIDTRKGMIEDARERGDAAYEKDLQEDIRKYEARLALPPPGELDLGVPDARAWVKDGIFRADLFRAGRTYHLALWPDEGQSEAAAEAEFRDLVLQRFRVRKTFEVPAGPGVCFPYGFIADDGRQPYDFQTTWRDRRVPGVLYTLRTGKNKPDETYAVEPYILAAGLPDFGGTLAGLLGERSVRRRIGLQPTAIGPYPATFAGHELQGAPAAAPKSGPGAKSAGEPDRAYQVVSGLAGLPGSDSVPYVYFELNGFGRGKVESLKKNPPPLDSVLPAMHGILKSVRLKMPPPGTL